MKQLVDVRDLTKADVDGLIARALHFKNKLYYPTYPDYALATMFYENSTRTRLSFELAAKQLELMVVDFDVQSSSEAKGEVIEDTVQTLISMGVKVLIIRHPQNGVPARLAAQFRHRVSIVNAGDGQHAHPSQALLDLMTIVEHKPLIERLKIAIVGDLRHSRVANSFQLLSALMGVGELVLVAPPAWQPEQVYYGHVTSSLQAGLSNADVVVTLRVQRERLKEEEQLDLNVYREAYALTQKALAMAKPDAIVMHPGPLNRGVEIDSDVADGPQSVIWQQVQNGVMMRMAILDWLLHDETC
jgi:aspartate carbamoyltransferase catalytic subunit